MCVSFTTVSDGGGTHLLPGKNTPIEAFCEYPVYALPVNPSTAKPAENVDAVVLSNGTCKGFCAFYVLAR
jgi:hypothetical protein